LPRRHLHSTPGAVNTVAKNEKGQLIGYNTDWLAIYQLTKQQLASFGQSTGTAQKKSQLLPGSDQSCINDAWPTQIIFLLVLSSEQVVQRVQLAML